MIAKTDGSDAHELMPGIGNQELLGWSGDGAGILYSDVETGGIGLVDLNGDSIWSVARNKLCAFPCAGSDGFALSPDGAHVAFVRNDPNVSDSTVVVILDIATGQVQELESTRTFGSSLERCWERTDCEGIDDVPRWSPDGTQLSFNRQHMSPEEGSAWTSGAVYVVDADGSDLHRVTPTGWFALGATWSPDGSRLVFTNIEMIVNQSHTSVTGERSDVYTVRPDGTDLQRLTNGGASALPHWTADGRLTFTHWIGETYGEQYENVVMNVDGSTKTTLGASLAELSSAGCLTCLYTPPGDEYRGFPAFWQP
jgi:Tol biopolymer transport system component